MTGTFIRVQDLVLDYPLGPLSRGSVKAMMMGLLGGARADAKPKFVRALSGVNLIIHEGERVGVIGANGSGKSTLVRAIAGVYPPTGGSVVSQGVIQSMFDLATGFEVEATGRENIKYRGLVMGFSPSEIEAREEEIIAFTELGNFIDLPVRTYSAGMMVRLAFAISTYLRGDILLIDEVFAAGDASFQAKAVARMQNMIDSARIVVMVAHDLSLMQGLMTRVIWVRQSKIEMDGDPHEVTAAYLNFAMQSAA